MQRRALEKERKRLFTLCIYLYTLPCTLFVVVSPLHICNPKPKKKDRGEIKENLHKTRARHIHNTTTTNKRDDDEKCERARTLTRPDPGTRTVRSTTFHFFLVEQQIHTLRHFCRALCAEHDWRRRGEQTRARDEFFEFCSTGNDESIERVSKD